jgi:aryl-alcohol dehydrogenase-like predicted oxidoreductase
MQTRRFGRTDHMSSVAIFGGAAVWDVTQAQADAAIEHVLAAGVNHIDVAPSYGKAEARIGPWMPQIRKQVFLGCKTLERTRQGAWDELQRSLEKLRTDSFDLYQIHAITSLEQLDEVLHPGSVIDAILDARAQGLTRYIGITGHGKDSPAVFLQALKRFDFDSILFPINFVQFADPQYRADTLTLLDECRKRQVGTMIIKAIGKGVWRDQPRNHTTWYDVFDTPDEVQAGVNFALSQEVTGLCTAGDLQVLPLFLRACENFQPLSAEAQQALITSAARYESVFALNGP